MRIHLLCIHNRISCVYTRDLLGPVPGPGPRLFLGPWPLGSLAQSVVHMHKRSLVYTQEILLCIHNKCILILSYYTILVSDDYSIIISQDSFITN